MPIGSAIAAALISGALGAAGGIAGGVMKSKSDDKKNQQEKDLATIHTTKPGFDDFGNELLDDQGNDTRLSIQNAGKPVIFPGSNSGGYGGLLKKKPFTFQNTNLN